MTVGRRRLSLPSPRRSSFAATAPRPDGDTRRKSWQRTLRSRYARLVLTRLRAIGAALARAAREPRQPLLGVALCAVVGIGVTDGWTGGPWLPLGGFVALAAGWWRWRKGWLCWLSVVAAFGSLHVFRQEAVPARALASRLAAAGPQSVRAVGRVADEPRARPGAPNARFTLTLEHIEFGGRVWPSRAPVTVSWPVAAGAGGPSAGVVVPTLPALGDRVGIVGTARNLEPPRNPGQADFAALARRRGILSELRAWRGPGGETAVSQPATGVRAVLARATTRTRRWMAGMLALDLRDDPEAAAVVRSMILGLNANALSEPDDLGLERGELGQALQETGTLHFFAVDGLKIGLLVGLGLFTLRLLGLRPEVGGVLAVPVLGFYALATGFGPASVRATLTAGVLAFGLLRDRPTRAFNNLGAAATLILLWDSQQLFSRGFQLTFVVVAVILLLHRPLLRGPLGRLGEPDPFLPRQLWGSWRRAFVEPTRRAALGLLGISFAAWLGSMPLMIHWFHLVSFSSVPANVLVFPFAFAVLALGVLALAAALVSNGWAALINNANWLCAKALIGVVKFAALAPGGHLYVGRVSDYPRLTPWREQPAAELTILDLPRGASALHLRAGRADWLLDAGRAFDFDPILRPALHVRGVNRLDALILRQDDVMHAGAAPLVLTEFRPRALLESPLQTSRSAARRDWNLALAAAGRTSTLARAGDVLTVSRGGVELRVLYPTPGLAPRLADDRALVLQLRTAGSVARVLLMANAGEETERWLLANAGAESLRNEVLVLGAHKEGSTGSTEFLRAVRPGMVIFQADLQGGFGNAPSGLTDTEVATALAPSVPRPAILRTEQSGAITLRLWRDRLEAIEFLGKKTRVMRP